MGCRLGVELPGLDDPGKAFAPCTKAEILGLYYDTERWVWYMPEDKGRRCWRTGGAGGVAL